MPFYDFECNDCNKEFEVFAAVSQKSSNDIVCPECGSTKLKTIYKGFNVIKSKTNTAPSCPHIGSCGGCS